MPGATFEIPPFLSPTRVDATLGADVYTGLSLNPSFENDLGNAEQALV